MCITTIDICGGMKGHVDWVRGRGESVLSGKKRRSCHQCGILQCVSWFGRRMAKVDGQSCCCLAVELSYEGRPVGMHELQFLRRGDGVGMGGPTRYPLSRFARAFFAARRSTASHQRQDSRFPANIARYVTSWSTVLLTSRLLHAKLRHAS
jgi:hypothetical protein